MKKIASRGLFVLAAAGIIAAVLILGLFFFVPSHGVDQQAWCNNNIRQIDAVIEQWTLEHKKTNGTPVFASDIAPYFKNGELPKCPIHETYLFTNVGDVPVCSLPANQHKIVY
jgi:hypothetical protein